MAKVAKIDKERRYKAIRKLVKKYHAPNTGNQLPEVKKMVAKEMGVSLGTVNNALKC